MISRYKGSFIEDYEQWDYNRLELLTGLKAEKTTDITVAKIPVFCIWLREDDRPWRFPRTTRWRLKMLVLKSSINASAMIINARNYLITLMNLTGGAKCFISQKETATFLTSSADRMVMSWSRLIQSIIIKRIRTSFYFGQSLGFQSFLLKGI